jgi:CBS domain
MIVLGVMSWLGGAVDGAVLALIGGFIVMAASAEQAQEQVLAAFAGGAVRELMSAPAITIAEETTLGDAQREFERHRYSSFPVTDARGRAVGLLTIDQLERTPISEHEREARGGVGRPRPSAARRRARGPLAAPRAPGFRPRRPRRCDRCRPSAGRAHFANRYPARDPHQTAAHQ